MVEDILLSGDKDTKTDFFRQLDSAFKLGTARTRSSRMFLGCTIDVSMYCAVSFSMESYLQLVNLIHLSRNRGRQLQERPDNRENVHYRILAGALLYLGQTVLSQASMIESKMQKNLGLLKVVHLLTANDMVRELKRRVPYISYLRPKGVTDITMFPSLTLPMVALMRTMVKREY